MSKLYQVLALTTLVAFCAGGVLAGDFDEVDKGKIPAELLEKSVKKLASGIAIWDEDETIAAMNDKESKVLWIDTRPSSFFTEGTFKDAVLLVYNKNETHSAAELEKETSLLKKESLEAAMAASGATTLAFFCQGPKCHRSYNAALRAVSTWGIDTENVIWVRCGYPNLLKHIKASPKLERKMKRYLQGNVMN